MDIQKIRIRGLVIASGLAVIGVVGLAVSARAGEGGIAGSAAFTVDSGNVIGVAVSAAVGKESAAAHAFNYDGSNDNGLQNSAFAIGTAGTLTIEGLGEPAGFILDTMEDPDRATAQNNSFTSGGVFDINIGTQTGNTLVDMP